ncbi:hypothetical protein PoB_001652600 [Plakobranchus ocellatus]|uniref:Uncharacterized protein n=1 Tax=Plakobranchus ocellatus TaxID=259542 RepID=A0AAV3YSD0_9GAST|nr:hypothetical protein PoB_001652600 [Plakobranchus ocellatus]
MSNKCDIVNYKGKYIEENECRVFRLPKDELERQKWLEVLPPRESCTGTCQMCFSTAFPTLRKTTKDCVLLQTSVKKARLAD